MARRPQVRYWPSRNGYCCWFRGKQKLLAEGPDDSPDGPTYRAALKQFIALTFPQNTEQMKDSNTARVICEKYLQWLSSRRKTRTLKFRQHVFIAFTDALGEVMVKDLTHHKIYEWFDQMRLWRINKGTGKKTRWTDGSIRNACSSLQAAFNWAARSGLITRNPLTGLEQPSARSRGRHSLIGQTPEERKKNHKRILAAASKAFRPFIVCLEATGCRPGELAAAIAADFHPEIGAIIYHADNKRLEHEFSHKTGQKGKDRIIMLQGDALEIVRDLARKHPHGPLFRTGKPKRGDKQGQSPSGWKNKSITRSFRTIRDKVELPYLTAYSYRHTFATSWLEQGRNIDILAELLGNSPNVIRHHYSHLLGDVGNLRRQLDEFKSSAADTQTVPPKDEVPVLKVV